MTDEVDALNGIREADFLGWKHHPVTKVYLRYLCDFRDQLRQLQQKEIENSDEPLPPKKQGEYKGRVLTLDELAAIEFRHLLEFYPLPEEEDNDAA